MAVGIDLDAVHHISVGIDLRRSDILVRFKLPDFHIIDAEGLSGHADVVLNIGSFRFQLIGIDH